MVDSVGIVGGGIMGCLAALAFTRRGKRVTLFERCPKLMSRASRGNEGKIHLGFTYGLDETGATRDMMLRYGSRFEQGLGDLMEIDVEQLFLHRRQYYAVHRDSMLSEEGVAAHMAALGSSLPARDVLPVRRLTSKERGASFSEQIRDVYEVAESSINCDVLVRSVREAVETNPDITVMTEAHIVRIADGVTPEVIGASNESLGAFDLVINAAWEGMPLLENEAGAPLPDYCLRIKVGFVAKVLEGLPSMPVTFTYGSFGDVVPRPENTAYMSWYPACLVGFTNDLNQPHEWYETTMAQFDFDQAYARTCEAFSGLLTGFRASPVPLERIGGPILAIAKTDIPDRKSQLHDRTHFGFHRRGNVIAIDTGKLTCGPLLAQELMDFTLG